MNNLDLTPHFRLARRSGFARGLLVAALIAGCTVSASAVDQTAHERIQALARAMTFDWAKSHPLTATFLGLSDEDGRLDTPSEAENARDLATIQISRQQFKNGKSQELHSFFNDLRAELKTLKTRKTKGGR